MKLYMPAIIVAALCVATSCDKGGSGKNGPLAKAKPIVLELPAKMATDNSFALDIFKTTCAEEEGNAFISPLSISMALNMVVNGARGETKEQMLEALRAGDYTLDEINSYSQELRKALLAVDPSTVINIANSIWYRNGYSVNPDFISTNKSYYEAEVRGLDFSSPDAVKTINGWCSQKTHGRIDKIVEEISPDMVMYLINAVYFKGIWVSPFDKKNTSKHDFTNAEGQTRQVDMMRQKEHFNYGSDEDAAYLELPYGNEAFSMLLVLPRADKTTGDVVAKLDNAYWNEIQERMADTEVNLGLPRLKVECEFKLHEEILPRMGMVIPFQPFDADFSGIGGGNLTISEVIHKTFLEINEEGTEAAAVTSVGMEVTYAPVPVDFVVNRPFLLAIKENSTGVILFMGRIDDIN